jgi:hypothetical protein
VLHGRFHPRFDRALFEATNQRRLRPTEESNMPNTIRTTGITTRARLALLALGAISLSAAIASPASAQAVDPNASGCRSAIGIIVNRGCLSVKPEDHGAARDRSNAGGAGGGYTAMPTDAKTKALLRDPLIDSPGVANYDSHGKITSVDYPELGIHDTSIPGGIMRQYPDGRGFVLFPNSNGGKPGFGPRGNGGNGGAAGRTGSRIAAPLPPGARTSATAAPPKAAVPKSTTVDKVANTTTRDYRTGATAAPGGPPPAAAIGTKPTAPQVAAQTPVVRDHRH